MLPAGSAPLVSAGSYPHGAAEWTAAPRVCPSPWSGAEVSDGCCPIGAERPGGDPPRLSDGGSITGPATGIPGLAGGQGACSGAGRFRFAQSAFSQSAPTTARVAPRVNELECSDLLCVGSNLRARKNDDPPMTAQRVACCEFCCEFLTTLRLIFGTLLRH